MKYLIVTVIILLVASGGWSLSCKVCDEGEKKPEDSDTFEDIPDRNHEHFLMKDLCKDDTPQAHRQPVMMTTSSASRGKWSSG